MNKNVIVAVLIVIILTVSLLLLLKGSQEKNSTTLSLNSTPPANNQQLTQMQTPTPQITLIPTTQYVSTNAATIKTIKGDIQIELYPQDTPRTVTNFTTLAHTGYYNNLTFHRVEPGFVIQGGDPNGNGTGGTSIYGSTFEDELNPATSSYKAGYSEGVVAMANAGPNTNGSQFFIMLADNTNLPHNYTIFGKVKTDMDVVKKIQKGDTIITIQVMP